MRCQKCKEKMVIVKHEFIREEGKEVYSFDCAECPKEGSK